MAVDSSGALFIADSFNNRIRRVDNVTGITTSVAGDGTPDFGGDGGPATSAQLYHPLGVAVDSSGNLFIADSGNSRIRRVDGVTGFITTVAGDGIRCFGGDGGPATSAHLYGPWGVAVDASSNLLIADTENYRIRRVDGVTGIITTVAGNGLIGFADEDEFGPATNARLNFPLGVAVDAFGDFFIADTQNSRVREVGADGIIFTIVGNSIPGYNGDGDCGPCTSLSEPYGVTVDGVGNLFITDEGNQRIRRMDAVTTTVTTVAGDGIRGFAGDNGAATDAMLYYPRDVVFDRAGNMFIADSGNYRARMVSRDVSKRNIRRRP
jgi:sugar lactone lactonase YvrE